ncbi:MAG: hypothetical protein H6710_04810 [Myxococcales bacterium]|nr:hypothetical protein [Myxococcales bacterium]
MGWMTRALGSAIVAASAPACVLSNPVFGDHESESGSASEGSASAGATTTTGGGATSAGASGSTGGDGETGSTAAGSTTLSFGTSTTTSTSTSGEGSTTSGGMAEPVVCDPAEQVVVPLMSPTENTYVVTSSGVNCPWTDSNFVVLNNSAPCETLNFGSPDVKYTLIGTSGGSRGEFLARFPVYDAMMQYPTYAISFAEVEIVPWWSSDRTDVVFHVDVVDADDRWVVGNKAAQTATVGDSTWVFRWIENDNALHTWKSGNGPAAGATPGGTIEVPFLMAGDHPWHKSSPIPGTLFDPWLASPEAGQGIVISTDDAPILIKNKDAGYPPRLYLTLCPLP